MKVESDELDESEKHWRLRYDSLIEEQNLLKNKELAYRHQLGSLHELLAAVSPNKRGGFTLPTSPRRTGDEVGSNQRRSSRSPPAKVRLNRDSMESVRSHTDHSNQSSQDFWVADIQGKLFFYLFSAIILN